ncbi:MAG: hypothetical protein AAB847_00785 [Patescibacteria group bacterium]
MFRGTCQLVRRLFCVEPKPPYYCNHNHRATPPIKLIILGKECELGELPCCPDCAQRYLNQTSVLCAVCDIPIFPGASVAASGLAEKQYVHNTMDCSMPGAYLGIWGEGELIHFSELQKN